MPVTPVFNPKRIEQARLIAGLTHASLAFEIRRVTGGDIKATEQNVRKWIKGQHSPGVDTVGAIAAATKQDISFFFEVEETDDEESRAVKVRRLRANLILAGHDDLAADLQEIAGLEGASL
jgi:transcriptional regulator with XRE-family HTH domain